MRVTPQLREVFLPRSKRIALVAHDNRKADLLEASAHFKLDLAAKIL